jgi:hypothetical protein
MNLCFSLLLVTLVYTEDPPVQAADVYHASFSFIAPLSLSLSPSLNHHDVRLCGASTNFCNMHIYVRIVQNKLPTSFAKTL